MFCMHFLSPPLNKVTDKTVWRDNTCKSKWIWVWTGHAWLWAGLILTMFNDGNPTTLNEIVRWSWMMRTYEVICFTVQVNWHSLRDTEENHAQPQDSTYGSMDESLEEEKCFTGQISWTVALEACVMRLPAWNVDRGRAASTFSWFFLFSSYGILYLNRPRSPPTPLPSFLVTFHDRDILFCATFSYSWYSELSPP